LGNGHFYTFLRNKAMTDNTPRPEPMSREQVLAALDHYTPEFRSAVAALYERCEALERAVNKKNEYLYFLQRDIRECEVAGLLRRGTELVKMAKDALNFTSLPAKRSANASEKL
jgi:hypothetical protein